MSHYWSREFHLLLTRIQIQQETVSIRHTEKNTTCVVAHVANQGPFDNHSVFRKPIVRYFCNYYSLDIEQALFLDRRVDNYVLTNQNDLKPCAVVRYDFEVWGFLRYVERYGLKRMQLCKKYGCVGRKTRKFYLAVEE